MTPKRTDANQAEIVRALRAAGRLVQDLHEVGRGCPDILVCAPSGRLVLLEIKAPGGRLNGRELAWHTEWARYGASVYVVWTADAALAVTK